MEWVVGVVELSGGDGRVDGLVGCLLVGVRDELEVLEVFG